MYVYELNMRDKIWFICLWYCILTTSTYLFNYIVHCKYSLAPRGKLFTRVK